MVGKRRGFKAAKRKGGRLKEAKWGGGDSKKPNGGNRSQNHSEDTESSPGEQKAIENSNHFTQKWQQKLLGNRENMLFIISIFITYVIKVFRTNCERFSLELSIMHVLTYVKACNNCNKFVEKCMV